MNNQSGVKLCRQRLFLDGVFVARCTVPNNVKHDHGKNVSRMVAKGVARYVRRSK